jgi:peptidoglycan/xylan/chitin deacetylase (PgdA/CDA1 family)
VKAGARETFAASAHELERARPPRMRARASLRRAALAAVTHIPHRRPRGVRIVHYHFVFHDEVAQFARQLEWFRSEFEPVALSEAVRRLETDEVGGNELVITFDDGFRNQARAAHLLADAGFSACFFLVTKLVGMPHDRVVTFCRETLHLPQPVEPLTWDEVATIASSNEIGSHTRTHPNLAALSRESLSEELQGSKLELETRLARSVRHVSAPYGDAARFSPSVSAAARECGYASCATARRGINLAGGDVYALRRDHLVAGWPLRDVRYFLSR